MQPRTSFFHLDPHVLTGYFSIYDLTEATLTYLESNLKIYESQSTNTKFLKNRANKQTDLLKITVHLE